ncbi:MAG: hypothetical protein V1754_00055, partial [Pseudomonadota bacterium]
MHRIALTIIFVSVFAPKLGIAETKRLWGFAPETGFVDDAMAFDVEEKRFAYVHTDSSSFLHIQIVAIGTFENLRKIEIKDPNRVPRMMDFTSDGNRLVFIWMDGYSGQNGAMLFDVTTGKLLKELRQGGDMSFLSVKGEKVLIRSELTDDNKGSSL